MDRKLVARAEQIELDATRDLWEAPSTEVGGELGLFAGVVGGAWAFGARSIPDIVMNRVIGLGVFGAARRDDIDRIGEGYAAGGVDRYLVHVAPETQPAELTAWLEAAGYRPFRRAWAKFARKAQWIDPPGGEAAASLAAVEIGPERAGEFARIVTDAFGLPELASGLLAALPGRPSWICYLATDGGRPIAAAAMFARGRDAWLGFGATLASARGRGAQTLLLSRRVSDAARLGATDVFTETGEAVEGEPQPSYQNIVKVGFKRIYSRANLVPPSAG